MKKLILRGSVALTAAASVFAFASTAPAGEKDWSVARKWNEQLLAAIRINTPRPPVHARNLYHTSAAMWDAWAAYDPVPDQVFHQEKVNPLPPDIEAARNEAVSFAAYRVLKSRFAAPQQGHAVTQPALDGQMDALGYDKTFTSTAGDTPAALGNRIAATILSTCPFDGSNELGGPVGYAANPPYIPVNPPILIDLPGIGGPLCQKTNDFIDLVNPNAWQPIAFEFFVDQGGTPYGAVTPAFVCPHWRGVRAFAMNKSDYVTTFHDPGLNPQLGGFLDAQFKTEVVELIMKSAELDPTDGETKDISPASFGNNSLGFNNGQGYSVNPATGLPYTPQIVLKADLWRVLSEFWADGPASETPPGHWNVVANEAVSDYPGFEKRIGGTGPIVNDLEWDVKLYLAMNGAVHDAAVTAWGIKGTYNGVRPITMIRYMGQRGQSSFPGAPSFHPDGLPIVKGYIELITEETIAPGGIHENLPEEIDPPDPKGGIPVPPCWEDHVGHIALRCWAGHPEDIETQFGGVDWIWSDRFMPFMASNFVTPPFAGYTSGHSTFSRSAAEVLTAITGDEFFPGGLGEFVAEAHDPKIPGSGYLEIEAGPTTEVKLQFARYYDGADQAGIARLYSGIHVKADDYSGRVTGSAVGIDAWAKAQQYFNGTVCYSDVSGDGSVNVDDLLLVINGWGTCAPGVPCFGDIVFTGNVNVDDLLKVISDWGACE
jgi:hypothetical protein